MKFHYEVSVEVTLTDEELWILGVLSKQHYDAHCRSVSQVGGFLYGMHNAQEHLSDRTHVLRFSEIDTLCKILEMGDTVSPVGSLLALSKPELLETAAALAGRLRGYLRAINAESARLHPR